MQRKIRPVNLIFGLLYALAIVFGFQCEYFGCINVKSPLTYLFIIVTAVVATLFSKITWDYILERCSHKNNQDTLDNKKNVWIISSAVIWVCYFITFLGVYPGFFVYDAQYELMETIARNYDNQHPIFHVLSMGAIIQGVHKLTDDYNIAIAVFIIFQMTIISIVLGYLIKSIYDEGVSKVAVIVLTLYFGLFPVLNMFALCSAKDGMFGAFLILSFIFIKKLVKQGEAFWMNKKNPILLSAFIVLMMLFRSNGVYAFIVYAILVAFIVDKKHIKKLAILACGSVVLYLLINGALLKITNASSVGHREILTVPIQQMARVYSYDNDSISAKDKAIITKYIPADALYRYNPKCSDLVKIDFNEKAYEDDTRGFYKIWLKTGINNPVAYIDALFMTSFGLWYPQATIDGYAGNQVFTFTYGESSYFGYETEEPGIRDSKIPLIDRFYRWLSLDGTVHHIPVVRFIFSPGFMLWVMLYILGYFIYAGRWRNTIPYLLPVIAICTCFIGPMSLVRYAYYLWILIPVGIIEIKNENYINEN